MSERSNSHRYISAPQDLRVQVAPKRDTRNPELRLLATNRVIRKVPDVKAATEILLMLDLIA